MRPLALIVAALFLPSCSVLSDLLGQLDKPTASLAGVQFRDLDLESLTLDFDVAVDNPYTFDLPLVELGYGLSSGGASILQGLLEPTGAIPAGSSKNLTVPAKIRFQDVLSLLSQVKPGSVIPYEAAFDIKLDVPGAEGYSIPLGTTGELPIPTVPDVQVSGIRWSELSLDQATANIGLSILNTNDFGFDLDNLLYALDLGGRQVAKAGVAPGTSFDAGERANLDIPISFSPKNLGLAVFNILTGSKADYNLSGSMNLDTPFGELVTPYAKSGVASLFK